MILVTGGTGFLGHNLLPMLVEQGLQVRAVSRHPEQHAWLKQLDIEVCEADVADREAIFQAMEGCTHVIHAAGLFRFWGNTNQFERTNITGTRNVMDAALTAGVQKVVHISTVVVVGNPQTGERDKAEIDETHPVNPVDAYQRSKLVAERQVLQYHTEQNLPVVVLRPGAFYGPHGRYGFNKMFFEDPLQYWPVGVSGGRFYTFPAYIKDVAQASILALEKGRPGEIYNICSQYLTHREVDRIIAEEAQISGFHLYFPGWVMIPFARVLTFFGKLTGREPKYPITLRSYIFNNWRVSAAKAKRELGFIPTPFREGVRETLQWYREIGIWKPKEKSNR